MGTGFRSLNSMAGLRCANPAYQVWVVMARGFHFPSSILSPYLRCVRIIGERGRVIFEGDLNRQFYERAGIVAGAKGAARLSAGF